MSSKPPRAGRKVRKKPSPDVGADAEHARLHALGLPHGHSRDYSSGRKPSKGRFASVGARANGAESHRAALPAGAGRGKLLFLDAFSGVAGDMSVAALVDLGVPFDVVERAVRQLRLPGVVPVLERANAGSIGATRFHVLVSGKQSERTYADIDRMLARSKLAPAVKLLSRAIFERLGRAEAEVHRIPIERVHFHEVGAADAIADIVGAAACFAHLDASEVVCTPLPLGRGFVECRHGILPLPAPAVVGCLKGVPTVSSDVEAELVTPTGAAIVATVASRFEAWPAFAPEHIGWGAGTAVFPDRPNALRVVLGSVGAAKKGDEVGTHVTLSANVDDMTGELSGHAIRMLLEAGAIDAWATPVTMKKGRPGLILSALARREDGARLAELVLRETSSIGVRFTSANRLERPRSVVNVETQFGEIPVKVSAGPYGAPVAKPEFDACEAAAKRAKVPVRVVVDAAVAAYGLSLR